MPPRPTSRPARRPHQRCCRSPVAGQHATRHGRRGLRRLCLGSRHRPNRHPDGQARRRVWATAWSPDGTRLATAGGDGAARIWDPTTGSLLTELTGHTGGVWALIWSPEGDRLVTAAADDTVRIWNPSTGTAAPTADSDVITAAAWSPGGTCLAAGEAAAPSRSGIPVRSPRGQPWLPIPARSARWPGHPTAVTSRPRGRAARSGSGKSSPAVASGNSRATQCSSRRRLVPGRHSSRHRSDERIRLWKLGVSRWLGRIDARIAATLAGRTHWIYAAAWSPDGTRIATGGHDRTVRLWEPGPGRRPPHSPDTLRLSTPSPGRRTALASPARAPTAPSGSGSRHPATRGHQELPATPPRCHSVDWSPDGAHLATGDRTGLVIVWDRQLREVASLSAQAVPVSRLVRAPDSPSASPAAPRSSNSATPPTSRPSVRQPPARAETARRAAGPPPPPHGPRATPRPAADPPPPERP